MKLTMPWQPMPAPTSEPSGTRVPVLWGQPEQKNGVRTACGLSVNASLAAVRAGARRSGGSTVVSTRRSGSTRPSAVSAPVSGISGWPSASRLPSTRGWSAAPYERVAHQRLDVRRLVLDDEDGRGARGEPADGLPVERVTARRA